jgi:TRAP transporter 4TM/12TM fusion protein
MSGGVQIGGSGQEAGRGGEWRPLFWFGVGVALFHLWANCLTTLPSLWMNSLHMALVGAFAFATLPGFRRFERVAGAALLLVSGIYPLLAEEVLHARGEVLVWHDHAAAVAAMTGLLLLCRRAAGRVMPVLAVLSLLYVLELGRWMDGVLHFRGLGWERVFYRFYFTGEGMFGFVATLSATYVFMFILFSAFLLRSGAGDFVVRLARRLTGRLPGGAGYVAVLASALTGTINGSAVANTVATGSITIPLMKRAGFSAVFAAGVETAASTGGQLLPPMMGAGAFLIAQYTGVPYATVIAAAALPALLYFFSLMLAVWMEARRLDLRPQPEANPEPLMQLLREGVPFALPLGLLTGLLAGGFSPAYAAGAALLAVVAATWLVPGLGMGPRAVAEAMVDGVRMAAPSAALLLTAGIVIGALNMTGTGVAFSQLVLGWSGGWLPAALVLVAAASLVLGMGLPVTAAYVVLAVVAGPALQELGVSLLAAHLIVFWFSQDSNITPPVCLAAFSAAGIAGSPPFATGMTAWRLAKGLYLIPVLFAFRPLIDAPWLERAGISAAAAVGLVHFFAAISGRIGNPLRVWQRALCVAGGVACFWPSWAWNLAGGALLLGLIWRSKSDKSADGSRD